MKGKSDVLTVLCTCRSLLISSNEPLQQPAKLPTEPYDHRKTYIAIIASDGDNMQVKPSPSLPARIVQAAACFYCNRMEAAQ